MEMDLDIDKEQNSSISLEKAEEEAYWKQVQDEELCPNAESNFGHEHESKVTAAGKAKKKRKRNRWRRNKKKSATPAGATQNEGTTVSKVSSSEVVCPIPAETPITCSYCSSTNLTNFREHSSKLPEVNEGIQDEAEESVTSLVLEIQENFIESRDNLDETRNGGEAELAENEILSDEEMAEPKSLEEGKEKKEEETADQDSRESEPSVHKTQVEVEPEGLQATLTTPKDDAPAPPLKNSYRSSSDLIFQDESEETIVESLKSVGNNSSAAVEDKSSNVAVIFRVGAAVFGAPQQQPPLEKIDSEKQLNPITGLLDEEKEIPDVEKYHTDPETKHRELWDGQDQIHGQKQDENNNNYVNITPYSVTQSNTELFEEKIEDNEEITSEDPGDNLLTELLRRSSSMTTEENAIVSPKILTVPHPSIEETSNDALTMPSSKQAPILYPASLSRRAIAKRTDPELDKVAKAVVTDVIANAEFFCYESELEEYVRQKAGKNIKDFMSTPTDYFRHESELVEYFHQKSVENTSDLNLNPRSKNNVLEEEQGQEKDLNSNNKEIMRHEIQESFDDVLREAELSFEKGIGKDDWVIDPKVIEDAVSEGIATGKSKKSSLVKSLRKCFGKKQKRGRKFAKQ